MGRSSNESKPTNGENTSAHPGFEAPVPVRKGLAADTATRGSASSISEATGRDLRAAQDHRSNPTTRRLAIMNLVLRGIRAGFGPENADTFRRAKLAVLN